MSALLSSKARLRVHFMVDILKQFDEAMFTIYRRAKSEAKYTASIFYNMLNDRGGLATAKLSIRLKNRTGILSCIYESA